MTVRPVLHRLACAIGLHRWTHWYAPTGRNFDPMYEERVECLWCLRRRA